MKNPPTAMRLRVSAMSVQPTPLNRRSIILFVFPAPPYRSGPARRRDHETSATILGAKAAHGHGVASEHSAHPLDPLRARGPRLKGIAEVLGLTGNLAVFELHDTHRVSRRAVIGEDEFGDPKVGGTEYALHGKALLVRLRRTRRLNIAPAADPLAGLRVFQHRILAINGMLRLKIVGIGRGPMPIEGRTYLLIAHIVLLRHQRTMPECNRF